jgi:heat shock protein HslJ
MAAAVSRSGVLAAAVALLACCTSVHSTNATFEGTQWRVTAINGHATPPPPASYRMRFEDRTLGGQFGCNHFGGDYRIAGDIMTTGAMMMTEMACSEPASNFEHWGMLVLQRPMRMSWTSGRQLTLNNDAGSITLVRTP